MFLMVAASFGLGTRGKSLWLTLDAQQPGRIAPQNGNLLRIGDGCGHDVIDRMFFPWDGVVGADDNLTGADLRHQVTQRFGGEHQRIEIQLFEIFRGLFLEHDIRVAVLRRDKAAVVGARRV